MRGVATAGGARWDAAHGVFLHRGERLPASLAPFRPAPLSLESDVESALNDDPPAPPLAPTGEITPRAHQREGAAAILAAAQAGRSGFLLADDVGLGKTITAWDAILRLPAKMKIGAVLIVCPLSVVAHWRRTVQAMGDGGKRVVILNYDRLGKLFEVTPEARKKIRSKKGLARAGSAAEFDVIVWDESHRRKNPTSARSKLAVKLDAKAKFILWLSATAGQNPLELSYLASLLASVTGARVTELKDFEAWCTKMDLGVARGAFGKWEWRGDPADCEKVRALLFDGKPAAGLRRRPEDLAGWPEINRMLTPIELGPEKRALYQAAWTEFRAAMDLARGGKGRDPKSALVAALRLRQKSSLLRSAGTVELVSELLENGHQVAISVAFLDTLAAIREALEKDGVACAAIHGALSATHREAERLRFQRGEAKVVLFTVEEGISLHQGEHSATFGSACLVGHEANDVVRSEVIHDLRWSAIQTAQIEGRCHRDGRFAQIYWTYADGTVEDRIARVVARRIQTMKSMIGDDTETLREIERLLVEAQ